MGQTMSQKKSNSTTKPLSFRFSEETAKLIKTRAARHNCSQVAYIEFLIKRESALEKRESDLTSYALARQQTKLDKLDYVIDDLGSVLLDFIHTYLLKEKVKELLAEGIKDNEAIVQAVDKEMNAFMKMHRKAIAAGKKGLIRRMYDITEDDITWEMMEERAQHFDAKTNKIETRE